MESIGERLKAARLKKKLTIEHVYKETKIHPGILESLEDDRAYGTLSRLYARSFLKAYAKYLGLDAGPILAEHDRISGKDEQPALQVSAADEKKEESDRAPKADIMAGMRKLLSPAKKWIIPAGAGILGVIIAVMILSAGIKAVKGIARRISRPRPPASEIKENNSADRDSSKPKPAPRSAQADLKQASVIPEDQPLSLIIKTKGDVWLRLWADDKIVLDRVLKKGTVEAWNAKERFRLWTGSGTLVELVLNGTPLPPLGYGVLKNIQITRKGLEVKK